MTSVTELLAESQSQALVPSAMTSVSELVSGSASRKWLASW
jgi:hypothetical protein